MVRIVPLASVLLFVAALANARILPSRSKQVKVYSYVLPAGAEEIRDDINHSFACANRTDGFYVDMDNDCQIFHRCQDNARFSFICAERTVFSQMYQTCVHDGQLGYPCEESAQYYPDGEDYGPSAPSSEAAEEAPQVEEMNRKQPVQTAPVQELEAPHAPSHAAEVVAPSEEAAQDNTRQPSEQAESVQVLNDEPEQQQEQAEQHQVNADLFDPIEEEGDVSSENSAQEVMDESEPSTLTVSLEATSADPANQDEESNEVEVMDDVIQQQQQQEHEQIVSSEPSSVVALSDTASQEEVTADEQAEKLETDTQGTPNELAPSATPETENETQNEADSLLNAVQMVEELEPIVHDLAVETDVLKPLVAEIVEDPTPSLFIPANQQDNEVLPESHSTHTADMEAPQMPSDASSTVNDSEQSSTALESDQQVNELSPQTELSSAATADDSSETADTVSVEADETVLPASEPETIDVKLEGAEADTPTKEQDRPMESPAIVEEMAPLRPNDSAELPELIVSTEFHLDAVTQGPPIRRRKTFLFRADAIRSRQ
ncbi:protein bangles and beads [Anopheles marshallii]|uniref:protein bangles and beads n=1 Tax=Anopheles marshallii TaxID=1521116 RepID=UPI00237AAD06|nr:protein bangles and beads [Anopheles marshallii]